MMQNPLLIIQNVQRATGWLPPIYKRDDYDDNDDYGASVYFSEINDLNDDDNEEECCICCGEPIKPFSINDVFWIIEVLAFSAAVLLAFNQSWLLVAICILVALICVALSDLMSVPSDNQ